MQEARKYMLGQFLQGQLDYVFFCYGLAFILLAAVCATMGRDPARRLPWVWLGLFGVTHGASEWLGMLELSIAGVPLLAPVRIAVTALSFLCLLEFGRRGLRQLRGRSPGRRIYLPLLVCAVAGGLAGTAGLEATIRYALALPGALWAAAVLHLASQDGRPGRRPLRVAAFALAAYAVAAGAIVPPAAFPPASLLNSASFLSFTGLPIQLIRGGLATLLTMAIWRYCYRHVRPLAYPDVRVADVGRHGLWLAAVVILVLAAGWVLTDSIGRSEGRRVRDTLLDQVTVAAAAVDPESVALLAASGDARPLGRLRDQLCEIQRGAPHLRSLRLLVLRGGRPVAVASSGLREAGAGDPQELRAAFASGRASAIGPFSDARGLFASVFVPMRDPATHRVLAVLAVDLNAEQWPGTVSTLRMLPICLVLLLVLLLIASSVLRLRAWESAQLIAASQRHLLEAQRIAHVGSWTYDVATGHVTWSEEMYRILGRDPHGHAKPAVDQPELFHPEDWPQLASVHRKAAREGVGYEMETRVVRPDGTIRHVVWRAHAQRARDGRVTRLLGAVQDITERKRTEEQLRELSLVDDLTGLSNRRGLAVLAAQQMRIADRSRQGLILVFADMDRLKSINDSFGHSEGDRALRDAAEVLRTTLRASDIIARVGGDEFVALAVETPETKAGAILARLQRSLQAFNARGERPYQISLSFGLVHYDWENPCSFDELLAQGDALMYQHKDRGRSEPPSPARGDSDAEPAAAG